MDERARDKPSCIDKPSHVDGLARVEREPFSAASTC
jgi:hypothetical protein